MLAGTVRRGARFTSFTVTMKDFVSVEKPSVTPIVAEAVPASRNPGARRTFPTPVPVPPVIVVTVTYAGPDTLLNVREYPSGSVAVRVWSAVAPSFTVMFAGWLRVGGRHESVIVNGRSACRIPSLARAAAGKVPVSPGGGARWMFPVVEEVVVTV